MKDILQDLFQASIGLTKLTREDLEKIFNELKTKGEVNEEERDFFISRTLEKLEETGKTITEKIMNVINPNLERVKELNKKVDELIKEVEALKKKKG
jgi:polyhydroxyalkanoate synthesis regulator phasin